MEFGGARKRGRTESGLNGNGNFKKYKQELESFSTGIGSKLKPCTKFFSTSGCPFGEGCHFLHYVPGGIKAVAQMTNPNIGGNAGTPRTGRHSAASPRFPDVSSPSATKSRICKKYYTAEGCNFGNKCRFAHGEWELGKPATSSYEDPQAPNYISGGHAELGSPDHRTAPARFVAVATAKISVDSSLVGAIIGKGGANTKQICRVTGAKLAIRESDTRNQMNIELEGTIDEINQASAMVQELISNVGSTRRSSVPDSRSAYSPSMYNHGSTYASSMNNHGSGYKSPMNCPGLSNTCPTKNPSSANGPWKSNIGMSFPSGSTSNLKRKLCENFAKGSCRFGEMCRFAHGTNELRRPRV